LGSHEQGQVRNRQLPIRKMVVESVKEQGHDLAGFCILHKFWVQFPVTGTRSAEPKKDRPCRRIKVIDEIKAAVERGAQIFHQE
jgi:hypothetical protein